MKSRVWGSFPLLSLVGRISHGRQAPAGHPSGLAVEIVLKQDQATGKTTRGIVREILTRSPTHPHGIKVRLTSGQVGGVKGVAPRQA